MKNDRLVLNTIAFLFMMTRGKEEKGEGRYVVLHNQLFRENDTSAYPVISIDLINIED